LISLFHLLSLLFFSWKLVIPQKVTTPTRMNLGLWPKHSYHYWTLAKFTTWCFHLWEGTVQGNEHHLIPNSTCGKEKWVKSEPF
jgi:hypothetical protein